MFLCYLYKIPEYLVITNLEIGNACLLPLPSLHLDNPFFTIPAYTPQVIQFFTITILDQPSTVQRQGGFIFDLDPNERQRPEGADRPRRHPFPHRKGPFLYKFLY